jgi:hypothetical protein
MKTKKKISLLKDKLVKTTFTIDKFSITTNFLNSHDLVKLPIKVLPFFFCNYTFKNTFSVSNQNKLHFLTHTFVLSTKKTHTFEKTYPKT